MDWSLDPLSGYRYPLEPVEQLQLHAARARIRSTRGCSGGSTAWWRWARATGWSRSGRHALASRAPSCCRRWTFFRPTRRGRACSGHAPWRWPCVRPTSRRRSPCSRRRPRSQRPEFLVPVLSALAEHTAWVEAHLEDQGAVPNNHLVSNYVGLLVVGLLFPELPGAPRQVALAVKGAAHADAGAGARGGHLLRGLHVLSPARGGAVHPGARGGARGRRDAGQGVRGAPASACSAPRARWCSEQGLAPQMGDNDSGRVFPLRERADQDHGYLAPLGAALFGEAFAGGRRVPGRGGVAAGQAGPGALPGAGPRLRRRPR